MSQEVIDYVAVLADLKQKRTEAERVVADLNAAIAAIGKTVIGSQPKAMADPGARTLFDPSTIKMDSFKKMTYTDAAEKYLRNVAQPQSLRSIIDSLLAGGIKTKAKRFYPNLYTAMSRDSRFKRFEKLWGLVEWDKKGG